MDISKLSDYQLYEIIQNDKLDNNIRALANGEFKKREINIVELKQIVAKHDALYVSNKEVGLKTYQKLLIIIFPIFLEIQMLVAGRLLANGYKRKWKNYWLYICVGYLLWTVAVILIGRFWLFKR